MQKWISEAFRDKKNLCFYKKGVTFVYCMFLTYKNGKNPNISPNFDALVSSKNTFESKQ